MYIHWSPIVLGALLCGTVSSAPINPTVQVANISPSHRLSARSPSGTWSAVKYHIAGIPPTAPMVNTDRNYQPVVDKIMEARKHGLKVKDDLGFIWDMKGVKKNSPGIRLGHISEWEAKYP